MKKLAWIFLAVVLVGFTSCGSDDDDEWIDGNEQGGGGDTGGGDPAVEGSGTKADPWNIAGAKANQGETYKWVKGYIVGQCNGINLGTAVFEAPFEPGNEAGEGTNMLIAASADVRDASQCLTVKLQGALRNMSLVADASNLGKEVLFQGDLAVYFGTGGITPNYAKIGDASFGVEVEAGDFDREVMSIADVRALYQGANVKISEDKKIVGVVISDKVGGNSTSLKNVIIAAEDNSCGITLRCIADASFSAGDKIEVKVKDLSLEVYNNGNLQLNGVPAAMIQKVGTAEVTPTVATVADLVANIDRYESTLVTVQGEIVAALASGKYGVSTKHTTNTIKNGDATIDSFVSRYAAFCNDDIPSGMKTITGIAGKDSNKPQLNIRNTSEVR